MKNQYEIGLFNLDPLKDTFTELPEDPYTPGGFRFRRLSLIKVIHGPDGTQLLQNHPQVLIQPATINDYLGDVERHYEPLKNSTVAHPTFMKMVRKFQEVTGFYGDVDVHQIRIKAVPGGGDPAPEGPHRDGYKFIGPFVASYTNIRGGNGKVYDKEGNVLVEARLDNKYMIVKDREVLHYADPITVRDETKDGFWDTFVFSAELDDDSSKYIE